MQIVFFTVVILYFGKAVFVPLSFALLIALIVFPFCKRLERNKWLRSIAIAAALLNVGLLFIAIGSLLLWQLNYLKHDLPVLLQKIQLAFQQLQQWVNGKVGVVFNLGTLNSIGLLLLGVEHAILFGMLTAFMTMVPYVGIIISSLLPITVAWVTTDSFIYPLGVVGIFAFVQYLENAVIFPKVVGQQLNVSTWAILVALMAGGIIWGVSGMVLFMPFVAILKIISSHIEEWRPLNILLIRAEKRKVIVSNTAWIKLLTNKI
jgi:predicted PurR-regulated permease PerM